MGAYTLRTLPKNAVLLKKVNNIPISKPVNNSKAFTHVISARNLTLTVRQKQDIELNGGVKTSVRKFGHNVTSITDTHKRFSVTPVDPEDTVIATNICKTQRDVSRMNSNRSNKESIVDENICVVCYTNNSDIVIMPCGHSEICEDCAKDVWKTTNLCYICQQEIDYMAKIESFSDDVVEIKYCIHLK